MSEFRIEKTALLKAPRAKVWRALTEAKQFAARFLATVDGEFVAGNRLRDVAGIAKYVEEAR